MDFTQFFLDGYWICALPFLFLLIAAAAFLFGGGR